MSEAVHQFTRTWGDDYTFEPIAGGQQGLMSGWKPGIRTGDFLILQNGTDTTRYQVDFIEYERDPSDMFRSLVWFMPRC